MCVNIEHVYENSYPLNTNLILFALHIQKLYTIKRIHSIEWEFVTKFIH